MLNENYHNALIAKYSSKQHCDKLAHLTSSIIFSNYESKNVYFNFPQNYDIQTLIDLLYGNLSTQIFLNYADLTDYSIGDRLKRKNEKGKNVYVIKKILGAQYVLTKEKDDTKFETYSTFDKLKRNYIQIEQNTRNSTLSNYNNFFKEINEYGFLPTHFSKKVVFIGGQTMWSRLRNKNCIPSIYLPNTKEGEQTRTKSIPALEDCIAYVTPKYEVCYEEILQKNIAIDAIIVCNTDLNNLSQILQDQAKYQFNLIVISNENIVNQSDNIALWNWQKEEIALIENNVNSQSIDTLTIIDDELDKLFDIFEESKKYVSIELEPPIKLGSYGYYVRLGFNALHEDEFNDILYRLKNNKELERNEGGYDIDFFGDKNPKIALRNLIEYLKERKNKIEKIKQFWQQSNKKALIVADREDIDFLKNQLNTKANILTYTELKKQLKNNGLKNKTLLFYSFDGSKKEFDFLYSLQNDIKLVLYKQEYNLFINQLQCYKTDVEKEMTSDDRLSLCKIKYEPIIENKVKISPTLESIINKLDERSQKAYDSYKEESDSLLDDVEEQINYQITCSNGHLFELESNETVFDTKGSLIKSYKLKIGDKIRIYPKEELAENLFQVAVEVEPEKFGMIDEHSNYWQEILKIFDDVLPNRGVLYKKLREYGLRVLPATVDAYFSGKRKFPMYNSDLKAVCLLADEVLPDAKFVQEMFPLIKKSKRLYNSTMIALGRGVKQELQQFLRDRTVGEILQKKNFTKETLQKFIEEYMPLLTITKIEEVSDEQ